MASTIEFWSLSLSYFLFHLVHFDPHILQILSSLGDDLFHREYFVLFLPLFFFRVLICVIGGTFFLLEVVERFGVNRSRLLIFLTYFIRVLRRIRFFKHAVVFASDLVRLLDKANEFALSGFLDLGCNRRLLVFLCL